MHSILETKKYEPKSVFKILEGIQAEKRFAVITKM
jgi:hypothetical protein